MIDIDALGPGGRYRTRKRVAVSDVSSLPVGELSVVPPLYVGRSMAALRAAWAPPAANRAVMLARAGQAFATAAVGGLTPQEYQCATSRISGLPVTLVRAASQRLARAARDAYQAAADGLPAGAVPDWRDPRSVGTGSAVWARRGDVLSVHAAGNHPGAHALWLQAVALGFKVAVRPSAREPLTPHRLVTALLDAGFGNVALLPTDHSGADQVIRQADLSVVYGSDDVIRKYAGSPTVLAQGPGRSKVLLARDCDWSAHLDAVVDSIAREAGATCLNTTAVFVEGDPAPVAEAIAERLSALPSLPPQDEKAVLPTVPTGVAASLERYLADRRGDARALGGQGIAEDLGDGSAVLRPAVLLLDRAGAPQARTELPFPCAWVAPWTPDDGIAPLRDSLIVTAFTCDEALIDQLVSEPTVASVHVGAPPADPPGRALPHDGYLSDFLMRVKSVVRS